MLRLLFATAAFAALAACSAAAPASAEQALPGPAVAAYADETSGEAYASRIVCTINTAETASGVLIEAVASANGAFAGVYDLVITKHGAGGSSDITQGGRFEARPGETLALGSAEIGLERGARVRAVLTLSDDSGELCRDVFTS